MADFLELGELMCRDALHREESCGGHFREEHQTEDGEALRDDERFAYVAAWEYTGDLTAPRLNKEPLDSSTCTWRSGATSEHVDLTLHVWRQAGPGVAGPHGAVRGARHQPGHVVPRDAGRGQRAADGDGRDARSRSTTTAARDLRLVQPHDQRRGARPQPGHRHLPAPHAELRGRRRDPRRAVAGAGVPGGEGPGRGPVARSTGSSRPAASSARRPAARRTATPS